MQNGVDSYNKKKRQCMASAPMMIESDYWEKYQVGQEDLDFINNYLFELETPQTTEQLLKAIVHNRVQLEKKNIENKQKGHGQIYLPMDSYKVNDQIQFPAMKWQQGKVKSIRDGNNPEFGEFKVIDVQFKDNEIHSFASELQNHPLNTASQEVLEPDLLTPDFILEHYSEELHTQLEEALATDPDLVLITGSWFPRALFVDINNGQLNLAEAVLDMAGGGPIPTRTLMEQLDLPRDVNTTLTEFSLNLALQEDPRFDEVGASGEVLWYLERLEPENVRNTPEFLQYQPAPVDRDLFSSQMVDLEKSLDDEYCTVCYDREKVTQAEVILTYPHWRAGTIPLTNRTKKLFPTALESPRVRFQFVDADTKSRFQGWVVRPSRYIVGLSDWYKENGVIPGSIITIHKSNPQGEVVIKVERKRVKEWLRTVLVGADGGTVYALLKQQVGTTYDERMATIVTDPDALDQIWQNPNHKRIPIEKVIIQTTKELIKLNPQGNVHAEELYAAVNVVKRCPPEVVFHTLLTSPAFIHVGDLYYRLSEQADQEEMSGN
jgi:hypothetical protein